MSRLQRMDFGHAGPWDVCITIPARNEAERLGPCLRAAATALAGRGGIVLVVNGSSDQTLARAAHFFATTETPGVVIDVPRPPADGGVGWARRCAVDAALEKVVPAGMIATTDADTRVAPDWVTANWDELARADLVCGRVEPDPRESAALPAVIGTRGAAEGEYEELTRRVMARLDPVPHDPDPRHLNAAGASLAFRPALYTDTGGFPAIPLAEDRAFAARAEARDWRVRHADAPRVVTSCRMTGRVRGGMADALRKRIHEADPLVDEMFEPAAATLLRAELKGELRRRMAERGADPSGRPLGFGAAWGRVVAARPELTRRRMRLSELQAELPRLREALTALESARSAVAAE